MKKITVGGIIAAVLIGLIIFLRISNDFPSGEADFIFHVRLADSKMYENGVYQEIFDLPPGEFRFKFIANGDSPQMLSISMRGDKFSFSEDFELKSTAHTTPISEYFTWNYTGEKKIKTSDWQSLEVSIDPHGNLQGPVSVMIVAT
ncbi:MAG: hypothetical protein ACE5RJ_00910 [Nitrosopumilaceae archaeon]